MKHNTIKKKLWRQSWNN